MSTRRKRHPTPRALGNNLLLTCIRPSSSLSSLPCLLFSCLPFLARTGREPGESDGLNPAHLQNNLLLCQPLLLVVLFPVLLLLLLLHSCLFSFYLFLLFLVRLFLLLRPTVFSFAFLPFSPSFLYSILLLSPLLHSLLDSSPAFLSFLTSTGRTGHPNPPPKIK